MAGDDAKILRVGIIQGGKIIEERLLRRTEPVTIGQSPKNTFYVPISKLPRSLTLFEAQGDTYTLCFGQGAQGKVSYRDQVHSLDELHSHPDVSRQGGVNRLALDEKCRGKMQLGDITLLFQFVPRPPVVPKPQLPASAKGGIGHALMQESAFLLAILASIIIQGGFIALSIVFETPADKIQKRNRLLESLKVDVEFNEDEEDVPIEPDDSDAEELIEELELAEETIIEETPPVIEEAPPPTPQPRPPERNRPEPREKAKERSPDTRQVRQTRVRNNTILKHITSDALGGNAGPDALAQGHADRLADAFRPVGGITVGTPDMEGSFRGGPRIEGEAGEGDRVQRLTKAERGKGRLQTGKAKRNTRRKEQRIRVRLRRGRKVAGSGQLDGSAVTRVFRRRQRAFQACYESRLRVNPGLSGKVTIRFTIGSAGRITNIAVSNNTTGDSAVGRCIIGKVRRWRFSPPENGSVTFTYPIVLSKG